MLADSTPFAHSPRPRVFTVESQASAEQVWRNGDCQPYWTRRNTSDALVPPNPNEFDNATLISRFCAFCGTRSIAVATDGFSKLMVGGRIPSRIASRQNMDSTAPAAPSRCPIDDLVD